jgi:putative ABC transport system permease protein
VVALAPTSVNPNSTLRAGDARARGIGVVLAVMVDAPAFDRVLAASGVPARLPPALTGARPGAGPLAAIVSPAVAASLSEAGSTGEAGSAGEAGPVEDSDEDPLEGSVVVQGETYRFRVAAITDSFPSVGAGSSRFVVLPLQALGPGVRPPVMTGFLVAGDTIDLDALIGIGDEGQRAWQAEASAAAADEADHPTTVTTWSEHRRGLEQTGVNQVLSFTFAVGAVGGSVLALFAIGFAVATGARSRGQVLSRLRTMGLSARQGRGLLVYELAPLVCAGALAGAATGAALPPLLGPALGLASFTDNTPVGARVDPVLLGGVLALVVAGLATAIAIEVVTNRRLRLGAALRLGEEN